MTVLEDILSQEIIQRLGWTLLHFIWQAMAVALLLAIMLRVMRKSTANLRYILACLALGLIVLLPIVTMQLIPVSVPYSAVNIEPVPVHPLSPTVEIPVAETVVLDEPVQPEIVTPVSTESWKQRTVESLESALPYIVSGWLVGVFALSLWHLGGWAQLQRLRRKMVKQVDDTLHSKLKVLAQRLRVNQTVQLVESALVQIPTVVGWLRPVILLPASALTGLTSEQLEAILAHELAHIKRFDYLINILQTVVEILGFYHPAVWWVSHKIRAERENCCDDLAVSISGDRVCYARALTSMEEIRAGRGQLVRSGGLAVAATGGTLLERIRRLVGKDAAEKNSFSCVPAATVILLIIALAIPATITLTARAQGMPEGLAGAVIKGIRANRDKFECGYLAWSSKRINNRFADSDRPATELAGQYELWWDGKKIATKYVRDQVYKDPEGRYTVEKEQGGTSYDGGVLSRKPDFHSGNWLGPQITRWRGLGSRDWLIQQDSKQEGISNDWSVVDDNGVKLIRVMTRNMNEKSIDYEAYSISDYDPSKGYGLVNEEWYNPDGSPRLKHTVKMLEVIPGGWFPIEVDFKSFTITDGRVYTHHHHALDIERCSFNDKSALPARVFKGAVDKQLKYQEKLQKYLAMELRGISDVKEAAKADKVKRGAREATEKFVTAAMAGDLEKAGKFAHPGKLPANQIADLNQIAKGQNLWIMAVVADDFDAIAVSSVIQGDHNRIGPLVFFLDREPQDGRDNWWVHDIDMETPDGAEAELKQFLEKHPEAEKIPSEKKPDVQVKDKSAEASEVRIVHFPMDRMVGVLKVRDPGSDDDSDRGLLSLPGWVLLGQAQGDVSIPAGKELRLEVSEDVTDFSFLADIEPKYLQVLKMSNTETTDDDLVHIKGLTGLLGLDLGSTAIKDPGLVHLSTLTSLRKLSLFNTQVSDAGLAHLSTLKSLKYLNLYITQVKGPGLKHLKSLTSLVRLDLAATPITNESLVHLAEMTWLKELELQDTDIGNKGLANLKPLRSLEELILGYADLKQGYSPITDEGLVYLKELGSLKHLYLLRTRVTDVGLAHLRNLKKLEALLLTETQITGEGLAFLKDLPKLKYLDLNKTAVTDKGLVYLKDLKSLSKLYISSDSISKADLEDLEKALPDCTVNVRRVSSTVRHPKPEPILAENIPTVLPTITKSSVPSAQDKTIIQVDCLVVEVFSDFKMDRETTIVAENILGGKIRLRDTEGDVLLRKAAGATAATKDKSAENKRVTQEQFKALTDMLTSRGYMKILMNPRIQVVDGKTAIVKSTQHVPIGTMTMRSTESDYLETKTKYEDVTDSLEITPNILEDGHITLQVEAAISSRFIPQGKEQTPIISRREISTRVRTSSGESLIIGGLTEKEPAPGDNVKNSKKRTAEVLFIITPTIITPAADSQEKTDMQVKAKSTLSAERLKQLGLAVIMYADDHDNKLPDTLEPLKPYIANEQDYLWLLDNVEYALKETKYFSNRPNIPVAYDKTQKEKQSGANVLFLDGHVEFLTPQRLSELDIKRAKFLIETWFLAVNKDFIENINHNADSPDEAKELFKLKSELLAAVDGSNKLSFIPPERNVSLLLKAVRAHKDSKVLAAPHIKCVEDKTAEIKVMSNETYFIVGYTEPNSPSEKPQPKLEKVEEGIYLSLTPNLAPNNNVYMQFEFQISKFLDLEERKFTGKAPYKPPKVQRKTQSLAYRVKNGQTFLFGGHKIADPQDGRTEQKDLLILITTHTIDSSEQDKPAKTENLMVTKPPRTATNVITQPVIAKSRTVRPKDNEQEKTEPATKQQPQIIQKLFKLKHHNSSQMAQIILPLVGEYGHISADERTNNLLVIDTTENLTRIEKIIAQFDVSIAEQAVQKSFKLKYRSPSQMAQILRPLLTKTGHVSADESTRILLLIDTPENLKRIEKIIAAFDVSKAKPTVTEIFKIRYGDPVEIVELLKKLINGPPGFGSIIEPGKEPIVLVPEPSRKWIIAKASAENMKQIGQWIEKLDREELAPTSLEQIDQQIIKQQKILKMRQEYINNDPVVKAISENVAKTEAELIAARQKFAQSHPKVRQKDRVLQLLKKRLNDMITALGKSFDDMMLPEPNLTLAPEVPLITNTWLESDMLEVLQDIASMAGIPIIPDETVVGSVTAELKDVPLDTALDIVLAGTPYVVKKTPYYYLVASALEPPEIQRRVYSAKKLSNLGKALLIYANDHEDKYPDSLHHLSEYSNVEELKWVLANVEYLARGKTIADRPDTVIAYDKKLLTEGKGTNVLFNDCHVDFVKPERLKELGISAAQILIDAKLLSVSEDLLKDIGLDANSISSSDAWSEHLLADSAAEPNSETYSLMLDELHVSFLLRAVQAHKDARVLSSPQVLCQEGKTAEIAILSEEYYVMGYTGPNDPSDEPESKKDKVEIGTRIWLKPELTPDNENVRLDFKLEISQLKGIIEGKYKGKYPYHKPIVDVISTEARTVVPNGKTLLIGGLKINEQVKKEPRAPRLKDLPLIGGVFSSTIKEPKMLLILVKPTITPQQKASKILPGQADSE